MNTSPYPFHIVNKQSIPAKKKVRREKSILSELLENDVSLWFIAGKRKELLRDFNFICIKVSELTKDVIFNLISHVVFVSNKVNAQLSRNWFCYAWKEKSMKRNTWIEERQGCISRETESFWVSTRLSLVIKADFGTLRISSPFLSSRTAPKPLLQMHPEKRINKLSSTIVRNMIHSYLLICAVSLVSLVDKKNINKKKTKLK